MGGNRYPCMGYGRTPCKGCFCYGSFTLLAAGIIRHRLVQRVACIAIDGAAGASAAIKIYCAIGRSIISIVSPADIIGIASTAMCMDFRIADGYDRNIWKISSIWAATANSRSYKSLKTRSISMDSGVLNRDGFTRKHQCASDACC